MKIFSFRILIILFLSILTFSLTNCRKDEDTKVPTVTILSPSLNAEIKEDSLLAIRIDASDESGLNKIEVLVDGINVGIITAQPYEVKWDCNGKIGSHTVKANAYDTKDNKGESGVITFKVVEKIHNKLFGYVKNSLGTVMKGASITITKLTGKKSLSQGDSIFIVNETKNMTPIAVTPQIRISKKGMSFTELSISENDRIEPITMSLTQAVLMSSSIPGQLATAGTNVIIVTDNNGYYEIKDLLPGNYSLTTTVTDYDNYQVNVTQPKGPIQKDIALTAKALPQVSSLTLSDGSKSITATWTALTNSTIKGYNTYEEHFLWYQAEMSEDAQYFYPKYSNFVKSNSATITGITYSIPAEDYNAKYGSYILPVNIDNVETPSGTTTLTKYIDVPKKSRTLQSFSLVSTTASKVFIPATSNHEIALHMRFYYTDVIQTLQFDSWKVEVSLDGITWTTEGTHVFPTESVNKYNYGYTKTFSMNSYKGKSIYLRTNPSAFPNADNRPIIENALNEYSQDGTDFLQITPPETAFTSNNTTISAGGTVIFTDQSTNSPTTWSWNFGDSGTSTLQNPSHTFSTAGNYTVTLTASNNFGSNTITKTNCITVTPIGSAPVANFSANQLIMTVGAEVTFMDQSTNTPTSWFWSFGDGVTSTLKSPSHIYSNTGNYSVTLTVTNSFGSDSETKANYITINPVTVSDNDGNSYKTIKIGTQTWMAENLKTTKYKNGTVIPNVSNRSEWESLTTGAFVWYDKDISNKSTYGALYNWYSVNTGNLCPTGWHVPSDAEWTKLTTYLGGESVAGGKLKETGTTHWSAPNTGATNETGFTALPGGSCSYSYIFEYIRYGGSWWSSTELNSDVAMSRDIDYYFTGVYTNDYIIKQSGLSVRCLKD